MVDCAMVRKLRKSRLKRWDRILEGLSASKGIQMDIFLAIE